MKKFERVERKSTNKIPPILKLGMDGMGVSWIHWQDAVIMQCTDKVKWSLGDPITLYGGMDRNGQDSTFDLFPIIACEDKTRRRRNSGVTNRILFRRDGNLCLYCGDMFPATKLTRDHVIPASRGGSNAMTNLATACIKCNHKKADRTPEEANMPLMAVPYQPSPNAHLILQNRRIIACQMDYLKGRLNEKELRMIEALNL